MAHVERPRGLELAPQMTTSRLEISGYFPQAARLIDKMAARVVMAMVVATAFIAGPAFAQTQPTRPSAFPTGPTVPSAFATAALSPCYPSRRYFGYFDVAPARRGYFDPDSPCYSGTIYPAYSAVTPFEFPKPSPKSEVPGSESLNAGEAKSRIEAKGYLEISGLEKDSRGIWRGKGTMKDGRPVNVTLDLEGNIYSTLSRLYIRIEPPPANR
jgi:hypothetical protein